ncbi:TetR/AcrR family transcriptional regulator [Sulfurimonas sp.]|uniref:TetR/AcrR family transcriptional regulator n=1 Tax=Sulfurimonas sp. TaxID=2022749 RepID=UPI0025D74446|nr:TetR/AcrR family transcriptional regulator [Sulfurimonas sp.]
MKEKKISITKEKIKRSAIELFNTKETLSITTNHIAKHAGISSGNLYYHYKNKEEIIREIYTEMSSTFVSFNSFEKIATSENPLKELSLMFDIYGELFWSYRFLMRDSAVLMAMDSELKTMFSKNQEKRISQIDGLLRYLISQDILEGIPNDEIPIRAKLHWFISAYWQVFTSSSSEITKDSIKEAKDIIFKIHIYPFLSDKGKNLVNQ